MGGHGVGVGAQTIPHFLGPTTAVVRLTIRVKLRSAAGLSIGEASPVFSGLGGRAHAHETETAISTAAPTKHHQTPTFGALDLVPAGKIDRTPSTEGVARAHSQGRVSRGELL